jgi:rare lipoprotein A
LKEQSSFFAGYHIESASQWAGVTWDRGCVMWRGISFAAISLAVTCTVSSAQVQADTVGIASYYGRQHQGQRTASGERFNGAGMTAAHRTLPFGTWIEVVNLANGRRVMVRVTDRGPYKRGRIVDVSERAANILGFIKTGTARVSISQRSAPKPMGVATAIGVGAIPSARR